MSACDTCVNYVYDEEDGVYECNVSMDEDDYGRLLSGASKACPFYQLDDEYGIVRKQM